MTKSLSAKTMPLFRGGITERLVWMARISFFRQDAPPFSPRGAAPTTPGAEDVEAELSTPTTLTKYRVPQGMNRRRTNEEEEENRTLKYSIKQHSGKHQYSVCLSKPPPCNVNLTQREIFDKPFRFTNNQTTHRVGHVSSGSNSCMSESSLAGRVSHFIKNWEIITQDPWVLNCVKGQ